MSQAQLSGAELIETGLAELQPYMLLSACDGAAAHSRYNGLVRRVASFRHAA